MNQRAETLRQPSNIYIKKGQAPVRRNETQANLTFEKAWEEEDPCQFLLKWVRQSSYIFQELKTRCGLVPHTNGLAREVGKRQKKKG